MNAQNPYSLVKGKVVKVHRENYNTVSVLVESDIKPEVGQYVMFYTFGRGEAPITVASHQDGVSLHTIRIVGDVTGYFQHIQEEETVYLRGPYGNTWGFEEAYGRDVIIISGGLGLAATRWLMEKIIQNRDNFKVVYSLYGSKSFQDLLYKEEYDSWTREIDFRVTIGTPDPVWTGRVGMITQLLEDIQTKNPSIFICGPDPMVKAVLDILSSKGVDKREIKVSLERHMKCSVGTCGHCMFGPFFVCKDGPVFRYSDIEYFYTKKGV